MVSEDKSSAPSGIITCGDSCYVSRRGQVLSIDGDQWLERWRNILDTAREVKVLELGCGSGRDSRYLSGLGLSLIAGDYSQPALEVCRRHAPIADIRLIDIREPLPFEDNLFPVVVASLCLHFFPWDKTMAIMDEIRRCLKAGGFLLARLNSTTDMHHCAVGQQEIEPGLYCVDGRLKRFFDREAVERLAGMEWKVYFLEESTVCRYESPKVLWEVVLEKR
jgi:SAM-dependent methyltransferase